MPSLAFEDSKLPPDIGKGLECQLQLGSCMRSSHDGANPGLVVRHSRESDALGEDPLLEQAIGQSHRQSGFADDHRSDRAFAEAGIEAERTETVFEETRVVPELVDDLRLFKEYVDRGQACCCDGWRM